MSATVSLTELRAGGTGDLASVAQIMEAAFDPRFGEAWTTAQCMGMLSLPGVWLTIASQGGVDAGFALSRATADEGELLLLATRPTHRRRGIGGALLRTVLAEAADRGVRKLHLEVRAGNEAIALYSREGFTKVGARRDYYRGGDGQNFDAFTYSSNPTDLASSAKRSFFPILTFPLLRSLRIGSIGRGSDSPIVARIGSKGI